MIRIPVARAWQRLIPLTAAIILAAGALAAGPALAFTVEGSAGTRLQAKPITTFDSPWAMTFLPGGDLLVTEQRGALYRVTQSGRKTRVGNVPTITYGGQGGLGDVVLDPDFADNRLVYLSFVDSSNGGETRGAVVVRARLTRANGPPALADIQRLWRQRPFVTGSGHFSHRITFGPPGTPYAGDLFITSGERQKQTPAQNMNVNLGKVIRLNHDGSVPRDNPFADKGGIARQFFSIGHRNMLGIDFDAAGRLWVTEMGPLHGDELNHVVAGENYGWPVVSNGDHYSGKPIPDHDKRPDFKAPATYWVPSIAPAGFVIYDGQRFHGWQGDGLIGGLAGRALVRVELEADDDAREAERYAWGKRVREVEQGPKGAVWVLEDNAGGRLLKLTPADSD